MRWMSSKRLDRRAGDREHAVIDLHAGARRGAVGQHVAGHRQQRRTTGGGEQQREQHDCQKEVRDRAGRDDEGTRADVLFVEHPTGDPVGGGHRRPRLHRARLDGAAAPARDPLRQRAGLTRFIRRHHFRPLMPVQLHVAAEWQPGELPDGANAIAPGSDRRAEADREHLDMHADKARREVMAKLVHKNQHAQYDNEGDDTLDKGRHDQACFRYG